MATEAIDPPQMVACDFLKKYYGSLCRSPGEVYKFYEDSSTFSRPNLDGVMSTASTMQGINSKLLSFEYNFDKVQVLNMDAQPSCSNGVMVLITGFLIGEGDKKRSFIQTFFLAKNAKGYFILNDIFKFATEFDEAVATAVAYEVTENNSATPLTEEKQESAQVPVQDAEVKQSEVVPEKVQQAEIKQSEVVAEKVQQAEVKHFEVVAEKKVQQAEIKQFKVVTEKVNGNGPMNPPSVDQKGEGVVDNKQPNTSDKKQAQEQPPKMSYASMLAKGSSVTSPVTRSTNRVVVVGPSANSYLDKKATPPPAEKKMLPPPQQTPTPRLAPPPPPPPPRRNNAPPSNSDNHSEGKGIYIGNLPPNIPFEDVEKAFETYGKVKEDGVQVRTYADGFCYGFVEFESSDAARKAIEAHTFWFGTYKSYVTEKKSPIQVSNGNGNMRSAPGKGEFRNDNNRRSRENSVEGRRNGGRYQNGNFGQNRGSNNKNQKDLGSNESPGQNRGSNSGGKQKVYQNGGGAVKAAAAN